MNDIGDFREKEHFSNAYDGSFQNQVYVYTEFYHLVKFIGCM